MSKPRGTFDGFDILAAIGLLLMSGAAAWIHAPAGAFLLGAALFFVGYRGA